METPYDRHYVEARETLLDAVEALGAHRDAVILVGAQASYPGSPSAFHCTNRGLRPPPGSSLLAARRIRRCQADPLRKLVHRLAVLVQLAEEVTEHRVPVYVGGLAHERSAGGMPPPETFVQGGGGHECGRDPCGIDQPSEVDEVPAHPGLAREGLDKPLGRRVRLIRWKRGGRRTVRSEGQWRM